MCNICTSEGRNAKCRAQAHLLSRFDAPRSRFSLIYPGNTQLLITRWFAQKSSSWRLPAWITSKSPRSSTCRGGSLPNGGNGSITNAGWSQGPTEVRKAALFFPLRALWKSRLSPVNSPRDWAFPFPVSVCRYSQARQWTAELWCPSVSPRSGVISTAMR